MFDVYLLIVNEAHMSGVGMSGQPPSTVIHWPLDSFCVFKLENIITCKGNIEIGRSLPTDC